MDRFKRRWLLTRRVVEQQAMSLAVRVAGHVLERTRGMAHQLSQWTDTLRPLPASATVETSVQSGTPAPPPQSTPTADRDASPPPPLATSEVRVEPPTSTSAASAPSKRPSPTAGDLSSSGSPPDPVRADPSTQADELPWRLTRFVRDHIASHQRRLRALGERSLPSPSSELDPNLTDAVELVRRARVSTRQLRAVLELFGEHVPVPERRRLRKRLRRLTRMLGELRDHDAVVAQLLELRTRLDDAEERLAIESLIVRLGHRDPHRDEAFAQLEAYRWDALEDALETVADTVVARWSRPQYDLRGVLAEAVTRRMERAFREPVELPVDDREALHRYRIHLKRLRYALRLLSPALGRAAKNLDRPLKRAQRAIGTSRDLDALRQRLGQEAEDARRQDLRALAASLERVQARIDAAWTTTEADVHQALEALDPSQLIEIARDALLDEGNIVEWRRETAPGSSHRGA